MARQASSAPAQVESSRKMALSSRVVRESAARPSRGHAGAASAVQLSTEVMARERLMQSRKYPRPLLSASAMHSSLPLEASVIGVHVLPGRQASHRVRWANAHSPTEP